MTAPGTTLEIRPDVVPVREGEPAPARARRRSPYLLLALILLVSGSATTLAMRRTSTTYDEIVMISGGARGYQTGNWQLAPEHPPLTQYMYGLLPYLAGAKYPAEPEVPPRDARASMEYRYRYAQIFFWATGNDPERIAFLGRLPAVLCALLLTILAFAFVRRSYGEHAGLLAAAIVAFIPDLLAHGGVAYNDVPVTLAFFLALWRIDLVVRNPAPARALIAGLAIGLALGIKSNAIALAPAAFLLLAAEVVARPADRQWGKLLLSAVLITALGTYLTLVLIYRGDFALTEYRYALRFVLNQVATAHAPAYLLGRNRFGGFWYYFPVSFIYKTSAGFHILLALSILYFAGRTRSLRQMLASPLRVPAFGAVVLVVLLLRSHLNIGFRYALPVLPLIAAIVAVAAARIWETDWNRLRMAVVIAFVWLIVHPLSYFPNFLAYVSEYGPGRDRNYEVFASSSLDWGQGLLQLRDFMREHQVDRVYLSYFGSAWPAGYGIDYLPLYSAPSLPPPPSKVFAGPPRYAAISATNLAGAYLAADPFKQFRGQQPAYVLGHAMYIYEVQQ